MTEKVIPLTKDILSQIGESPWESSWREGELELFSDQMTHKEQKVLFDRNWQAEKLKRAEEGKKGLTGFHHGTFYLRGVGQPRG